MNISDFEQIDDYEFLFLQNAELDESLNDPFEDNGWLDFYDYSIDD